MRWKTLLASLIAFTLVAAPLAAFAGPTAGEKVAAKTQPKTAKQKKPISKTAKELIHRHHHAAAKTAVKNTTKKKTLTKHPSAKYPSAKHQSAKHEVMKHQSAKHLSTKHHPVNHRLMNQSKRPAKAASRIAPSKPLKS
jgi:hypothetical protein